MSDQQDGSLKVGRGQQGNPSLLRAVQNGYEDEIRVLAEDFEVRIENRVSAERREAEARLEARLGAQMETRLQVERLAGEARLQGMLEAGLQGERVRLGAQMEARLQVERLAGEARLKAERVQTETRMREERVRGEAQLRAALVQMEGRVDAERVERYQVNHACLLCRGGGSAYCRYCRARSDIMLTKPHSYAGVREDNGRDRQGAARGGGGPGP